MTTAAAASSPWALGDYHRFAKQTVWEVGPRLVAACGIGPGQRVLDVAAGTGNAAIRAAQAGASVVASDLTPEHFDAGRREAAACGVTLEWVQADAQRMPFRDGEFDAVTSIFGAMFAPNHQAVADELVRVCRPGGTIGLASFTPGGLAGEFFAVVGSHAPPPPAGTQPPLRWGEEEHVRALFGDRVDLVEMRRDEYTEYCAGGPAGYRELFKTAFGPVVALYDALREEPQRLAALHRDLLAFAERADRGAPGGPAAYPYEYLQVIARRR